MDISKIIYFINSQKNKDDIWYFIDFVQPPRCGFLSMFGYNELDLICNFLVMNNYIISIDDLMDYLKAFRLLNISYEKYLKEKIKYDEKVFKYYYDSSYSKL